MNKSDQYNLKDKKALVYKTYHHKIAAGVYFKDYYTPISESPLWCYTRQLSQNISFANMAFGIDETRLFVFNYNQDIKVEGLIKYKDKFYQITRVEIRDDYHVDMLVYVRDHQTTDDHILNYGEDPDNMTPQEED